MTSGLGYGRIRLLEKIVKLHWDIKDPKLRSYTYNEVLFILQELLEEDGKPYQEGRFSSLRGHAVFREFTKYLLYRNLANFDSMLLFTSDKGTGKSSAAMMLARAWCSLLGIRFNPARHIAYNNADVMSKIDSLNKFEPIICVDGNSRIYIKQNNKKKSIRIDKLVDMKDYEVLSYNIKNDIFEYQKPITGAVYNKKDIIYEVELENGIKIRATKNHKFLTKTRGYVKLKNLDNDDEIVINEKKLFANISKIKNITKKSTKKVYDIVGMPNGNFVCSGAVISNCDESIRFASSADWAKKEHKELKKKLGQVRTKHLLYILCFPLKLYKLEKTYLESYVNYWCLTGDTKILIKDNIGTIRNWPIKNLTYKKNYKVASYNIKTKEIEYVRPATCIQTKKNVEVFEIELENGIKIKATEEHEFLTEAGDYKKLKDLTTDDKLLLNTKKCIGCGNEFIPNKQSMKWCDIDCKSKTIEYRENAKKYQKEYRKKNVDMIKEQNKNRYLKNKDKWANAYKLYREKNRKKARLYSINRRKNNPEYVRKLDRLWVLKNKDKVREYRSKKFIYRYKHDIIFKLKNKLGHALNDKLKSQNAKKLNSSIKYLGCTIKEFKIYMEKKFRKGMSWSNHGFYGWHIDHIKPCFAFDLKKKEEQRKCFHHTNMQPLWWYENLSKGKKYSGD